MSGSSGASLWKQRPESVDSRASTQALVLVWTENLLFQLFSVHSQKGERDRHENVMHSLRENLQKFLERKVDSAVRGERMAQQTLYEAEAEVEASNWDKRNSDIAVHVESQRFQLHQASRSADQAQRDKISLYGELELRNGLFQEDHAREEFVAKKQIEQDKLELMDCLASREESYDRESINDSDSGIPEQSKFLVRRQRILRS